MTIRLRVLLLTSCIFLVSTSAHATSPMYQWSQRFGAMDYNELGAAVAVDTAGNVVVVGSASPIPRGLGHTVVAKYNSSGVPQWSLALQGTLSNKAGGVAVDASGNVFVAGAFNGTLNLGGDDLVGAGDFYDVFVANTTRAVRINGAGALGARVPTLQTGSPWMPPATC